MSTLNQCLDAIGAVIAIRKAGKSASWLLVYKQGKFELLNGLNHPKEEVVIAQLTNRDCREGCNSHGWTLIRVKIRNLLIQGVIT